VTRVNPKLMTALRAAHHGASLGNERIIKLIFNATARATNVHEISGDSRSRITVWYCTLGMRATVNFPSSACPGRAACYGMCRGGRSRRSKETTMKRAVIACLLTLVALSMTGCPIYPSDGLCRSQWDCAPGYSCDEATGACYQPAPGCTRPADCTNASDTCTPAGICQVGSCHLLGCVAGYSCTIDRGAWACTLGTSSGSGGTTSSSGGASSTGGASSSSNSGLGGGSSGGASGTGGASSTGGTVAAGGISNTGGSAAPSSAGTSS